MEKESNLSITSSKKNHKFLNDGCFPIHVLIAITEKIVRTVFPPAPLCKLKQPQYVIFWSKSTHLDIEKKPSKRSHTTQLVHPCPPLASFQLACHSEMHFRGFCILALTPRLDPLRAMRMRLNGGGSTVDVAHGERGRN